jgi:hypothetical protein
MTMKRIPATLLAAAAVLSLGVGVALAQPNAGTSAASGYVFPDFWGQAPEQQMATTAPQQPYAAGVGIYVTRHESGAIMLFPPNPCSDVPECLVQLAGA